MLNGETRKRALSLLKKYELEEFRHHYPGSFRAACVRRWRSLRTLAFDPDLLLLDEPFSSLDYQTRLRASDEIHAIIKREHKTALLVTHDIAEAISMADRILVFTERPARVKEEHIITLSAPPSSHRAPQRAGIP
jgi:NitT/TauT family transport system ATP-binding protein